MKHPKQYDTTPETSKRMSHVKLKHGAAETMLAKTLWRSGIRYRCNYKALPGSPDIAITKYHVAIFVDGEFWHGYDWERRKARLRRNKEYWIEKIEENIARDQRNDIKLAALGWTAIHFWEKEVKKDVEGCASDIISMIAEQISMDGYPIVEE